MMPKLSMATFTSQLFVIKRAGQGLVVSITSVHDIIVNVPKSLTCK